MKLKQIHKLYLANFLTGLVFWYGIEKLFMKSIGLDATAVGIATALMLMLNLLFDIPAGMLADKWSRKGMLVVSALSLGIASLVLGLSQNIWQFLAGYVFYSAYVVSSNGTYQAMMYDLLREQGRAKQYTKFIGRSFGLFLGGAAVGNALGGIIASATNYALPFLISVVPCIINVGVILTLKEPTLHKSAATGSLAKRITESIQAISSILLVRTLAIVATLFWIVEIFKSDFGQLYFMRYVSAPEVFGFLWAIYAVCWAVGGVLAHRFDGRFTLLIVAATCPIILMSLVDNWIGIALFLFQGLTMGALQNQIEAAVQHATPSHVRASILSVLSSIGRGIAIPAALLLGWTFQNHGAPAAITIVAAVATIILLFWLIYASRKLRLAPIVDS